MEITERRTADIATLSLSGKLDNTNSLAVRSEEADEICLKLEYPRLKSNATHVLN